MQNLGLFDTAFVPLRDLLTSTEMGCDISDSIHVHARTLDDDDIKSLKGVPRKIQRDLQAAFAKERSMPITPVLPHVEAPAKPPPRSDAFSGVKGEAVSNGVAVVGMCWFCACAHDLLGVHARTRCCCRKQRPETCPSYRTSCWGLCCASARAPLAKCFDLLTVVIKLL